MTTGDETHGTFRNGGKVITTPGATLAEMAAIQADIDAKYPGAGRTGKLTIGGRPGTESPANGETT